MSYIERSTRSTPSILLFLLFLCLFRTRRCSVKLKAKVVSVWAMASHRLSLPTSHIPFASKRLGVPQLEFVGFDSKIFLRPSQVLGKPRKILSSIRAMGSSASSQKAESIEGIDYWYPFSRFCFYFVFLRNWKWVIFSLVGGIL